METINWNQIRRYLDLFGDNIYVYKFQVIRLPLTMDLDKSYLTEKGTHIETYIKNIKMPF